MTKQEVIEDKAIRIQDLLARINSHLADIQGMQRFSVGDRFVIHPWDGRPNEIEVTGFKSGESVCFVYLVNGEPAMSPGYRGIPHLWKTFSHWKDLEERIIRKIG